jgi:tetratricopeptide (TPR) repeat protein
MFLPKRRVRLFEDELWRDYPQTLDGLKALYDQEPERFFQKAERAWEIKDTKILAACADVLIARDDLRPAIGLRAGIALLLHDRPQDALAVVSRPEVAGVQHAKTAYCLARALAACGRFEEAGRAALRSLSLRRSFTDAATLLGRLDAIAQLERQTQDVLCWSLARQLMTHYAAVGACEPACGLLNRCLKLGPARGDPMLEEMLSVIETGLGFLHLPGPIGRFLDAAIRANAPDGRLSALKAQCEVLRGHAGEAAAMRAPAGAEADARDWRFCQALALEESGQLDAAIGQLGQLTLEHVEDQEVRHALAHCIGRSVVSTVRPRMTRRGGRKVFDLFPFSDELTLLRLRLNEMAGWVDHFVVVEAAQTFTGQAKPLTFREHEGEFADFGSKIIHLPIEAFPAHVDTPWAREFFQRDSAIAAISDICGEDDLVFISDVDEIVDGRAVEDFDGDFARLHMNLFRFFLNYRPMDWSEFRTGRTGAIFKGKYLKDRGLSYARVVLSRHKKDWCRILDAGWHFNSLGQAEKIARKYNTYAHASGDAAYRDAVALQELLGRIRAGQPEDEWERCEIDETFPKYVLQNRDALAELIL